MGIFWGDFVGKQKTCQSLLRAIVSRLGPWFSIIRMESCSCLQFFQRSFFPSVTIYCHLLLHIECMLVLFCLYTFVFALPSVLCFFRPFLDWIFSKENCELAKWSAKFKRKLKRQWQSRLELSLFLPFAPFAPWALFISSFFCLVAEPGLWSSSQDSWAHVACSCIYKCFFTMKLGKWRFSQA